MSNFVDQLTLGIASHRAGDLAAAETAYREVVRVDPTHAEALKLLSALCFERGELVEAVGFAELALAQRPTSGEYAHLLGRIKLRQGELDAAATLLARAANAGVPDRIAVLLDLAACHGRRKAWRDSMAAASAVLSEQPLQLDARRFAGYACFSLGQDSEALAHFERALAGDPSQAGIWHASSVIFLRGGNAAAAYDMASKACVLAPNNTEYAYQRRLAAAKAVPDWHFNMVNDRARNAAFASAISALVQPEQLVLEIGTGSGLLAMMAARHLVTGGAGRVITCEESPILARVAADTVIANGMDHLVRVVAKRSSALAVGVDLPELADLLICEVFSVQVVAEGVLAAVEDAKARLLKPGAAVIPADASALGALVGGEALSHKVRAEQVHGFDLSALGAFSPLVQYLQPGLDLTLMSEAHELMSFDFAGGTRFPPENRNVRLKVSAPGTCQGVVQWLRLDLAPGIAYENRPDSVKVGDSQHWAPVFYPFAEAIELEVGQEVSLLVSHNRIALRVELAARAGG